MSFEGRDIPKFQRKGSRWKEMADYLLANPSRAAFVAAEEGKSLKRVRSSGQHALCRYIPRVQSTIQDGGVYFWIPREKLSHDAIGCPFVPAGDIPRKFVPRENK